MKPSALGMLQGMESLSATVHPEFKYLWPQLLAGEQFHFPKQIWLRPCWKTTVREFGSEQYQNSGPLISSS